jgi:3',5'-cyclic AMP phosphodiesterase CpdA
LERPIGALRGLSRSAARSLWRTQGEVLGAPTRKSAAFLTKQVLLWLWNYLKVVFTPRQPFPTYAAPAGTRPGIYTLPESCVIGLAADWGTGTRSAYAVADAIRAGNPDVTIHLGDVYYSGTEDEFRNYFLAAGAWPRGRLARTRGGAQGTYTLNGNHEMYSGGAGYFRRALPALAQEASYFCLENANWRIVGLDTGYYAKSFPFLELIINFIRLHRTNRRWLKDVVFANPGDRRPVILLSHHQWFSAFDTEYQRIGSELSPYLDRVLLWFWGHEHRFAGYAPFGFNGKRVRARCIGHGGMPIELGGKISRPERPLVFTDERKATDVDGEAIGYCGYAMLRLDGPQLRVEYFDETRTKLLEEVWQSGPSGTTGSVALGDRLTSYRPLADLVS